MTDMKEVQEWYALALKKKVNEFDCYDMHVCDVVEGFLKYQKIKVVTDCGADGVKLSCKTCGSTLKTYKK